MEKRFKDIRFPLFFCITFISVYLHGNSPEAVHNNPTDQQKTVLIGTLKIPAVLVKGGTFDMGDQFNVGNDDEEPVHQVTLSDFYLSTTEVTVAQYKEFCRMTKRKMPQQEDYSSNDHPIIFATWYDAKDFCEWVGGELPTEAQWEYAARSGGLSIKWPTGDGIDHTLANFSGKGKKDRWDKASPVEKFPPNALGLYDMAGNIYEWCYDYYKSDYYKYSNSIDPQGPATSMFKVLRGGSWYHGNDNMRCADRFRFMPTARISFVGFRVAWNPEKAESFIYQSIR